jgi:hypothetical protein
VLAPLSAAAESLLETRTVLRTVQEIVSLAPEVSCLVESFVNEHARQQKPRCPLSRVILGAMHSCYF